MKTIHSEFFLIIFSLFVCIESFKLDVGTLQKPGAGFIPFWSGICLGILTIILCIQKLWFDKANELKEKKEEIKWKAVILASISLFVCILILERLGFIISTILLNGFLLKFIEKKGWVTIIITSLIMTFASYYIFKVLLQAELPKGIFGF